MYVIVFLSNENSSFFNPTVLLKTTSSLPVGKRPSLLSKTTSTKADIVAVPEPSYKVMDENTWSKACLSSGVTFVYASLRTNRIAEKKLLFPEPFLPTIQLVRGASYQQHCKKD